MPTPAQETFEEHLKRKYGADPTAPTGVTGTSTAPTETFEDVLKRQTASQQIPGRETTRGTFVPDLGGVYTESAQSTSEAVRRRSVSNSLDEIVKSEELLRMHGMQPPDELRPEDSSLPAALRIPLSILSQFQRGQYAVVGGLEGILQGDPSLAAKNFYRGLILAEPHNTQDILERYNIIDNAAGKFAVGLAGDVLFDPITWLSFGSSAVARGTLTAGYKASIESVLKFGKRPWELTAHELMAMSKSADTANIIEHAMTKAVQLRPYLSRIGNKLLTEAIKTVPEEQAVDAVLKEIMAGSKIGKKLIPYGAKIAHWVPTIGGKRIIDVAKEGLEKLGVGHDLLPGGVLQHFDDIEASQSIFDRITGALVGTPIGKFGSLFGQNFVPYWGLLRKYSAVVELDQAMKAKQFGKLNEIREKISKIIKLVPAGADRDLLTELYSNPAKILGKKFVTITRTSGEGIDLAFNSDYFPAGTKLGARHAEYITDIFLSVLRHENSVAEPLTVGRGSFGAFIGGEIPDLLRPIFEGVISAHPNTKKFTIRMGDWGLKIPRLFSNREEIVKFREIATRLRSGATFQSLHSADKERVFNAVNSVYKAIYSARDEAYMLEKLGDHPQVAQGRIAWRTLKEFIGFDLEDITDVGMSPVTGPSYYKDSIEWAKYVGGWENYKRLVPANQRLAHDFNSYARAQEQVLSTLQMQNVPIIVKRFVAGNRLDRHFESGMLKTIEDVQRGAKIVSGVHKLIDDIARMGTVVHDFSLENMILDQNTGLPVLIDTAVFTDHARGVTSAPLIVQSHGLPVTQAQRKTAKVEALIGETVLMAPKRKVAGRGDVTALLLGESPHYEHAAVGAPGFKLRRQPIEAPLIEGGEPAGAYSQRLSQHLENSYRLALADFARDSATAHGTILDEVLENTVTQIHRGSITDTGVIHYGRRRDALLTLGQELKDSGAVTDYTLTTLSNNPYGLTVNWNISPDKAFTPIRQTQHFTKQRKWEQIIEVIADKHPNFLAMSSEKQASILAAYNLIKEWKTDIDQTLLQRMLLDPHKLDEFKRTYGLNNIPEFKKLRHPADVFSALNRSITRGTDVRGIKYKDLPAILDAFKLKFHKDLYETDIATIMATHAIQSMVATDSSDMIREIAALYGKPVKWGTEKVIKTTAKGRKWADQAVPLADPGWSAIDHPLLKGIQLPQEVTSFLTRYNKTFTGDSPARKIWRQYYFPLLSVWKGYATVVNPGFHARNFMSNLFNLYLKDGPHAFNPKIHGLVAEGMSGLNLEKLIEVGPSGAKVTLQHMLDEARRFNIYGGGWVGADIPIAENADNVLDTLLEKTGKWDNILGLNSPMLKAGRKVGGAIENEGRLVGFFNDYIKTGNASWSAMNTKKYLFDYNELTDFERYTMKGLMPFYTWMRKNVQLQAEQIIANPGKYGNLEKIKRNMEAVSPKVDERFLPKYFPELYAIRTPLTSNRGSSMYINPNLPFQDLNRIFDPKDWLSSLAPWRAVAEIALNTRFFDMRKIEKFKGERAQVEWLDAIDKLNPPLAAGIAKLVFAKKILEPETQTWNYAMPTKLRYAIEQANPFLRNIRETTGFLSGETPYYKKERRPWDLLSKVIGVKFIPYNVTEEFEKTIFERRDALRDMQKSMRQQGLLPSKYFPESKLPPRTP